MNSSKPRYQQLKDDIILQIARGELKPRDRVPSEHDLVHSAGVSRMTANRALRELNSEGYVERIAGAGTFVADQKARSHPLEVRNIADEIRHRGHQHSAEVLLQTKEHAPASIARALAVPAASHLFHLQLVHSESGLPIQLEDRYVLPDFAPDILAQDFLATTPSAYLTGIAPLQEAEHRVRASFPDSHTRTALHMDAHTPCLVVVRRTWAGGRPVSYGRLYHPGDRFELTGHYVPPGTPPDSSDN